MGRNRGSGQLRFTVSGPDIDKSYTDEGPAVSAAITAGDHAQVGATIYVRDVDEQVIVRVEKGETATTVHRVPRTKAVA